MSNPLPELHPGSDAMQTSLRDHFQAILDQGNVVRTDSEGAQYRADIPAPFLNAALAYLKQFPPTNMPAADKPKGALKDFADSQDKPAAPLPFPRRA